MEYRLLQTTNPDDVDLVDELRDYVTHALPDEPDESFHAFFLYFLPTGTQKEETTRSVSKAISAAKNHTDNPDTSLWKEWAEKWRWMERAMVYDFAGYGDDLAKNFSQ